MATTYPKRPLAVFDPQNSMLGYAVREHEEAATQTFSKDSPVVVTAGYIAEAAAAAATAVFGFALRAARNGTAGQYRTEFIPAYHGLAFYASFLADAGTDNVIARADYGTNFRLRRNAILPGSAVAWHVADTATTAGAKMVTSKSDLTAQGDDSSGRVQDGDTNARPMFILLDSIRTWK